MSGIRYTAVNPGGGTKFRHVFSIEAGGATNRTSFSDTFTLPIGTLGAFSVTGIGFQPDFLIILGINTPTDVSGGGFHVFDSIHGMHVGMATATSQWCGSIGAPDLPINEQRHKRWSDTNILSVTDQGGNLDAEGSVSMDADGFTLNMTTAPANDMLCIYLAMQGGSYAVGTELAPGVLGAQSITGLGFQPAAVFFCSVQAEALATTENDWRWLFGGMSDPSFYGSGDPAPTYSCWAGARSGDNYSQQLLYGDTPLFFAIDAGPAGPPTEPFNPEVLAEADLQSFDADGFTLNWSYINASFGGSTPRYYGWFAVDGPAEVIRWAYPFGGFVQTRLKPRGMLFFNNQLNFDCSKPSQQDTDVDPANMGIGVCDRFANQAHIACAEWSQPPFDVEQNTSDIYLGEAFGAQNGKVGGLIGNTGITGDDRGIVRLMGRDHLLRLHLSQ